MLWLGAGVGVGVRVALALPEGCGRCEADGPAEAGRPDGVTSVWGGGVAGGRVLDDRAGEGVTTGQARGPLAGEAGVAALAGERPAHGGRGQLLGVIGGDALAEQRNGQQAAPGGRTDTEEPGAHAHGDAHVHGAEGGVSGVKGK